MKSKILLIATSANSLVNFRYHLIKEFINKGYMVTACAAVDNNNKNIVIELQKLGIKLIPIRLKNTGLNFFGDLKTIYNLYKLIKTEQPDLVLSYTIKPVIYGSWAARLAKVPAIYSIITGLGYVFVGDTFKIKILRTIVKKMCAVALRFNQKVFLQNPDDLELLVNNKIVNKSKTGVINGSGVDINYYVASPYPNNCTFLLMARLIKEKGIYEYVAAAKQLKRRYPNLEFKLLGSYYESPNAIVKSEIQGWINAGIINYLGHIDDVRSVIKNASILVLPSFYREGLPRSILEAMAMARPIITTDAPGCRETVVDGLNGYLVPVKNVDKLVSAMEQFILQPELIAKMGQASRRIAEQKFDVHKVNKAIFAAMGI